MNAHSATLTAPPGRTSWARSTRARRSRAPFSARRRSRWACPFVWWSSKRLAAQRLDNFLMEVYTAAMGLVGLALVDPRFERHRASAAVALIVLRGFAPGLRGGRLARRRPRPRLRGAAPRRRIAGWHWRHRPELAEPGAQDGRHQRLRRSAPPAFTTSRRPRAQRLDLAPDPTGECLDSQPVYRGSTLSTSAAATRDAFCSLAPVPALVRRQAPGRART